MNPLLILGTILLTSATVSAEPIDWSHVFATGLSEDSEYHLRAIAKHALDDRETGKQPETFPHVLDRDESPFPDEERAAQIGRALRQGINLSDQFSSDQLYYILCHSPSAARELVKLHDVRKDEDTPATVARSFKAVHEEYKLPDWRIRGQAVVVINFFYTLWSSIESYQSEREVFPDNHELDGPAHGRISKEEAEDWMAIGLASTAWGAAAQVLAHAHGFGDSVQPFAWTALVTALAIFVLLKEVDARIKDAQCQERLRD